MLPEIVDPDVHQLTGIQSASAQMRRLGSVGACAVKGIIDPVIGQGLVEDAGLIVRVPGKRSIYIFKKTFVDHSCLSGSVFFSWTAKIQDRTGELFSLHDVFQKEGAGHDSAAQKVVAAAMAGRGLKGRGGGDIRRLSHAGEGVIFS